MSLQDKYELPHQTAEGTKDIPRFHVKSWPTHRIEAILAYAGTGTVVLDVGCSDGVLLWHLRDRFEELIGLEYSKGALERAKINLSDWRFRPVWGSAEAMEGIESNSVDVIVSADVIEHVPDVYAAVSEMYRVLKPEGRIVINTPNVASIMKRIRLFLGRFPSTSLPNEGLGNPQHTDPLFDGGHLHYFTYRSLQLLLERSGFEIEQRIGFGKWGRLHNFWPTLLSGGAQIVGRKPADSVPDRA